MEGYCVTRRCKDQGSEFGQPQFPASSCSLPRPSILLKQLKVDGCCQQLAASSIVVDHFHLPVIPSCINPTTQFCRLCLPDGCLLGANRTLCCICTAPSLRKSQKRQTVAESCSYDWSPSSTCLVAPEGPVSGSCVRVFHASHTNFESPDCFRKYLVVSGI